MTDRLFAFRECRLRMSRARFAALCAAALCLGCVFAPFERAAAQIRPGPRPIPPPGSFRFPALRLLNGTADDDDQANAATVDAEDNVIAAGTILNADTGRDFTVAKFNRFGDTAWVRVEERMLRGEALAVAVDSQQNVIAAGWERDGSGADFPVVRKYSPAGDLIFEQAVAEDIGGVVIDRGSRILAVAVDRQDNIVAVGRLVTIQDFFSTRGEMLVWKLDPSGREAWRRQLAGTRPDGDSEARAVAIDPFDNVIVAGLVDNLNTGADAAVVKLRPDGSLVFRVERPDPPRRAGLA
jgi:hypothetical protein